MLEPEIIQTALKRAGFYAGEIDGEFGEQSLKATNAALTAAKVRHEAWPHSRRMVAIRQWTLREAGFDPGALDGLEGARTRAAELEFRKPALGAKQKALPWIVEAEKVKGLHEHLNADELRRWLREDGETVGDPRKLPWCGDFVETAMAKALPKEPLPENPYGARNWATWGEDAKERYGAVIVFWRGKREGWQGHVGFAVGLDRARGRVLVLGGNQGDRVSTAWLGLDRVLAWRAPTGWAKKMPGIDAISSGGAALSTNEA